MIYKEKPTNCKYTVWWNVTKEILLGVTVEIDTYGISTVLQCSVFYRQLFFCDISLCWLDWTQVILASGSYRLDRRQTHYSCWAILASFSPVRLELNIPAHWLDGFRWRTLLLDTKSSVLTSWVPSVEDKSFQNAGLTSIFELF